MTLNKNNLTSIPESIGNLSSLLELHLDNNKLQSIPQSIGDLNSLKVLHLKDNRLKSIPESIGNLSSLEYLNLAKNNLTSLPDSLDKLNIELKLKGNQFEKIPYSLRKIYKNRFNKEAEDFELERTYF